MLKFFCALLISSTLFQANAAEMVIFEETASNRHNDRFIMGSFDTNKELGRAWVTLDFRAGRSQSPDPQIRVQIPNMKFDKTTKEIVIEAEEGRIVCAYEKRGFLGIKNIKNTNDCRFKESYETVSIDDGYHIRKILKRKITFSY